MVDLKGDYLMARKTYKVRGCVLDNQDRPLAIHGRKPHVFQMPGGTRKPSEKRRKALRREMQEETGYKVKIIQKITTIMVKRDGTKEITDFYLCRIKGGSGKPTLTKRESRRGLHVRRYESVDALCEALRAHVSDYGHAACVRDYRLATAAAEVI